MSEVKVPGWEFAALTGLLGSLIIVGRAAGAPPPEKYSVRVENGIKEDTGESVPERRVYINNQYVGITPLTLQLSAGTYMVYAEPPEGYELSEIEVL